jgi:hypothetical protein
MPLDVDQLKQLELRAKSEQFAPEDGRLVKALIAAHIDLTNLLQDPDTTLEQIYAYLQMNDSDTASDNTASDNTGSDRSNARRRKMKRTT